MSESINDDVLHIDEVVELTPPGSPTPRWTIKSKPSAEEEERFRNLRRPKPIPRLTPQTKPTLRQPAIINGRQVSTVEQIKLTTTLQELRQRQQNSYQKFMTREGEIIFLEKAIIDRINFEYIQTKKGREHTINLPQRHLVRLKVKVSGEIVFHHYRRRGCSKFKKAQIIEPDCSTGVENVEDQHQNLK